MSDRRHDPESVAARLALVAALGAVILRREIDMADVARLLEIEHRTLVRLLRGCIGGFPSKRLVAARLTIEVVRLDSRGIPIPSDTAR
jgi:hypothetical protein